MNKSRNLRGGNLKKYILSFHANGVVSTHHYNNQLVGTFEGGIFNASKSSTELSSHFLKSTTRTRVIGAEINNLFEFISSLNLQLGIL